jgi:Lar family restriction alleviation protein
MTTADDADALKPCPFCGYAANLRNKSAIGGWDGESYSVGCFECGIEIREYLNRQCAINKWNTRASPKPESEQ